MSLRQAAPEHSSGAACIIEVILNNGGGGDHAAFYEMSLHCQVSVVFKNASC
jgi:hypothetical protein